MADYDVMPNIKDYVGNGVDISKKSGIIKVGSDYVDADRDVVIAQGVANRIKREEIVKKGIAMKKPIYADGDLGSFAENIRPETGTYDVVLHGTSRFVQFFGESIDDKTLAEIIKGRSDYHDEPVRLISCSTGDTTDTADCFAQRLANCLGAVVKAPSHKVFVFSNGELKVGKFNQGEFKMFYPRK